MSVVVIGQLKIMRLGLKHHQLIQRPVVAADVDAAWVTAHKFLVAHAANAKDKKPDEDDLPKLIMSDWARTKEIITNHFSEIYGDDGIPFAYLLRENVAVPAAALDPQAGYEDNHDAELIARAPHTGASYRANNKMLCRLLKKICQDTAAYSYVSAYTTDGRAAWFVLMQNYLGPQHTQLQAAIWEAKLQHSRYTGESVRFNYEKYCDIHQLGHTRLTALEANGYKGIDEGTKIRYFLGGIHCADLKTPVELCRGNAAYATYDSVARRIKDSVVIVKPMHHPLPKRKVSDMHTKESGEPYGDVEADMSVEDKFYPPETWAKLSAAKKKGIFLKRKKRSGKHKAPKKDGKTSAKDSRAIKALQKEMRAEMAKVTRKVSAMQKPVAGSDMDESDSDQSSDEESVQKKKKQKTNNPNNPALNRKKTGKKK